MENLLETIDQASLRQEILKRTSNGLDIVSAMIEIAKGDGYTKTSDRYKALEWLSLHSFGKPVERVEVEVSIAHLIKEGRERAVTSRLPVEN